MKITTPPVLLLIFLLSASTLIGGNKKYPVSDIPPALMKNAVAVVRSRTEVFERKNLKNSVQKVTYAITILNKGGEAMGYFFQPYSSFSRIGHITGVIYDRNGKKVKEFKKEEIVDVLYLQSLSLYSDLRVKIIHTNFDDYPYTVEYSFTVNYSSSMNIPQWSLYPGYHVSVQHEKFTMITPDADGSHPEYGVHYYTNDSTLKLQKKTEEEKTILTLEVDNLQPLTYEYFSQSISNYGPSVRFAPIGFSVAGFKGYFDSWEHYGNFMMKLNSGKDELSDKVQTEIKSLVTGKTDKHEKIRTLYEYMQNKVRYVSEQKGIQGWQPIEAQRVYDVSYGDCKGLTNYMKSLLKVADIQAQYTLIQAGSDADPILANFPSNQFNHAILCVPLETDTVWLECTSQHAPCGYLGDFTDDRLALVLDEQNGAKLVKTPAFNDSVNRKVRISQVTLSENGACDINIHTTFTGLFYDDNLGLCLAPHEKQKQKLLEQTYFPTLSLHDFSFKENKKPIPEIIANINLEVSGYATKAGNRLLIEPYLYAKENKSHISKTKRR